MAVKLVIAWIWVVCALFASYEGHLYMSSVPLTCLEVSIWLTSGVMTVILFFLDAIREARKTDPRNILVAITIWLAGLGFGFGGLLFVLVLISWSEVTGSRLTDP